MGGIPRRGSDTVKILLLLIVAAGLGFLVWKGLRMESAPPAQAPLETVAVKRGDISERVRATATITPENKLEIKSPVAGRAESVLADIGQFVKQGQVLALMSSEERAALLDAARSKGEKEVKFWEDVYKAAPLVAPLDGQIISRTLVPGQVVQSTDIVFIMSDHLIAKADMDETDLAHVFLGQKADVTLDSYPQNVFAGQVFKIDYNSTTTNNVTTYGVDVALQKAPAQARSGMTANVSFIAAERTNVLLLPADAIQGTNFVLLPPATPGASPDAKTITTGLSDGKLVEIVSGLKEGDTVLRSAYSLPSEPKAGLSILPNMGGGKKSGGGDGPPPP